MLYLDVAKAIAEMLPYAAEGAQYAAQPLSEKQYSALTESAVLHTANLESRFVARLVEELEREGVDVYGLPEGMASIMGRKETEKAA